MFIQTESTPNPQTMKFLPGVSVLGGGTAEFKTLEDTFGKSKLAQALFEVNGVKSVFFGGDFITVTKDEASEWSLLKPSILTTIMDHFVAGFPVMETLGANQTKSDIDVDNLSDIEKQIMELIETRVRPAVAMDGGDIVYRGFEDGIVQLELHGSCSGCPSSTATLKSGIENMLKHYVPEVISVEAVNS
jgi:Fe-S cluster biogenesis protein NfuA